MVRPRAFARRLRDWIREIRAARAEFIRDEPAVASAIHSGRWE